MYTERSIELVNLLKAVFYKRFLKEEDDQEDEEIKKTIDNALGSLNKLDQLKVVGLKARDSTHTVIARMVLEYATIYVLDAKNEVKEGKPKRMAENDKAQFIEIFHNAINHINKYTSS